MRSHYDTLDLAPTASPADVKRAFRREIAKYHPDKVAHLGREFQAIAADKTAELTQAYTVLTDASLRADYDAQLRTGLTPPSPKSRPEATARVFSEDASSPEPSARRGSMFSQDRAGASALVRKAAVMRFREALTQEFGRCDEAPVQGFDVTCASPGGSFFSRSAAPRILGRFVAQVDAAAVQESWTLASRAMRDERRDLCVFVMGPDVAGAEELGRAVAEQQRKPVPAGAGVVLVPVNTRTWSAHIPGDVPPAAKALIARLQAG